MNRNLQQLILGSLWAAAGCNIGTPGEASTATGDDLSTSPGSTVQEPAPTSSTATATTPTSATDGPDDPGTSSTGSSSSTAPSTTDPTTSESLTDTGADTSTGAPVCAPVAVDVVGAVGFANTGEQVTQALAIDGEGRLTALFASTGSCGDPATLDLGGPTLELGPDDQNDLVLAGFDHALGQTWQLHFAGPGDATAVDVARDGAGRIFLLATLSGHLDIPKSLSESDVDTTLSSPGHVGSVLAVFSVDGAHLWSEILAGDGDIAAQGLAVAPDGRFAVGGRYHGDPAFAEPSCPDVPVDEGQAFVAVYDWEMEMDTPKREWIRCSTGLGDGFHRAVAYGVAVDHSGGVVATGSYWGDVAFGPVDDPNSPATGDASEGDVFVAAWTDAGEFTWRITCGTQQPDRGARVLVGADGRVILAGQLGAGSKCETGVGISDHPRGFVAALDPTTRPPTWIFERALSTDGVLNGVAEAPCGDIVVSGVARPGAVWEPDTPFGDDTFGGAQDDIVVARLTAQGDPVWGLRFGSGLADGADALALASDGDIYLGGSYRGPVQVAQGTKLPAPIMCVEDSPQQEAFLVHLTQ